MKQRKKEIMMGNVVNIKNGKATKGKDGTWTNEFGYKLWVPKNQKQMKERLQILLDGINKKKWKGVKLQRAKDHANRTRYFLVNELEARLTKAFIAEAKAINE